MGKSERDRQIIVTGLFNGNDFFWYAVAQKNSFIWKCHFFSFLNRQYSVFYWFSWIQHKYGLVWHLFVNESCSRHNSTSKCASIMNLLFIFTRNINALNIFTLLVGRKTHCKYFKYHNHAVQILIAFLAVVLQCYFK